MLTKIRLAVVASALAFAMVGGSALACPSRDSEKAEAKADKPVPAGAAVAAFRVNGMHCAGCEDHVREALNKVDGIYKVDVKMADKRVVVRFDKAKVSADKIAKAITDAGFQASAEV